MLGARPGAEPHQRPEARRPRRHMQAHDDEPLHETEGGTHREGLPRRTAPGTVACVATMTPATTATPPSARFCTPARNPTALAPPAAGPVRPRGRARAPRGRRGGRRPGQGRPRRRPRAAQVPTGRGPAPCRGRPRRRWGRRRRSEGWAVAGARVGAARRSGGRGSRCTAGTATGDAEGRPRARSGCVLKRHFRLRRRTVLGHHHRRRDWSGPQDVNVATGDGRPPSPSSSSGGSDRQARSSSRAAATKRVPRPTPANEGGRFRSATSSPGACSGAQAAIAALAPAKIAPASDDAFADDQSGHEEGLRPRTRAGARARARACARRCPRPPRQCAMVSPASQVTSGRSPKCCRMTMKATAPRRPPRGRGCQDESGSLITRLPHPPRSDSAVGTVRFRADLTGQRAARRSATRP